MAWHGIARRERHIHRFFSTLPQYYSFVCMYKNLLFATMQRRQAGSGLASSRTAGLQPRTPKYGDHVQLLPIRSRGVIPPHPVLLYSTTGTSTCNCCSSLPGRSPPPSQLSPPPQASVPSRNPGLLSPKGSDRSHGIHASQLKPRGAAHTCATGPMAAAAVVPWKMVTVWGR